MDVHKTLNSIYATLGICDFISTYFPCDFSENEKKSFKCRRGVHMLKRWQDSKFCKFYKYFSKIWKKFLILKIPFSIHSYTLAKVLYKNLILVNQSYSGSFQTFFPNDSEPIRKKFRFSFVAKRSKINSTQSDPF